MIRTHRRFHKLFWLVATPLLVAFFLFFKPSGSTTLMPAQDIPEGSSIAVFQTDSESNSDK